MTDELHLKETSFQLSAESIKKTKSKQGDFLDDFLVEIEKRRKLLRSDVFTKPLSKKQE